LRTPILLPTTLALLLAGLSACGDDITDPASLLDSAEAEAVMRSAEALPTLAELIQGVDPAGERDRATLLRARELWDDGTATDDPRGASRRRLAISYALPVLEEGVVGEQWADVRLRVDGWIGTAESMLQHLALPSVERRIGSARRYLDRADRSEDYGRYYVLLAASELVETTPRYVARALSLEAERVVGAAEAAPPDTHPEKSLERARRLKDWSARAVEEGDYLLAIQRAYYAMQLVSTP
jgi:hypothetical protein